MFPPYYRGCWHGVSRNFFYKYCLYSSLLKEIYNLIGLLLSRSIAGSSFRPLSKIPHCCLVSKFGPCLSPNVADHSFKSAKDRRLGCPLQNQLPNPIKARPLTKLIFIYYQVFYTQLKGRLPRHYSPVRYVFVKH